MAPRMEKSRFRLAYDTAAHVVEVVFGGESVEPCLEDYFRFREDKFIERIARPKRDTLLHEFIQSIHTSDLEYWTGHSPEESIDLFVLHFELYDRKLPSWLNKSEVYDHRFRLDELLSSITNLLAKDVSHLLFADRVFLLEFQKIVANSISELCVEDHPSILRIDGVVKRPGALPSWLRQAVYFRDQGRCQRCNKDISGLLCTCDELQFDHMVPLARSGSNDPTNFQLICRNCNQIKGSGAGDTSSRYVPYWSDS